MVEPEIRVYPTQTELVTLHKPPPVYDSDVWGCAIKRPQGPLPVYLHNRAKRSILYHAQETPRREVGGALIGGTYAASDRDQPKSTTYIEIVAAIRGDFTQGNSVALTFTPDTWSQIVAEAETQYPKHRIVGWYHTHPGHGVFLSDDDKFIQNHFFYHSNQLALVVDHIRLRAAFFVGSERAGERLFQSSEFTWNEALYKLSPPTRVERLPSVEPDQGRSDDDQAVDEAQTRQVHGALSRFFSRFSPFRKPKTQAAPTGQNEPILRIDYEDLSSPSTAPPTQASIRRPLRYEATRRRYTDLELQPQALIFLALVLWAGAVLFSIVLIVLNAGDLALVNKLSEHPVIHVFLGPLIKVTMGLALGGFVLVCYATILSIWRRIQD